MVGNKIEELEQRLQNLEGQMLTMEALAQDVVTCKRTESVLQQRLGFEGLVREYPPNLLILCPPKSMRGSIMPLRRSESLPRRIDAMSLSLIVPLSSSSAIPMSIAIRAYKS